MPVLSLACHLPHNTPHIPSRYNNEQTTKQTKAINNSYIYINISCKCDTNRAGHFTLDAYASRPVACVFFVANPNNRLKQDFESPLITLTPYMVLPLFATRFADYAGGIRVSFIQPETDTATSLLIWYKMFCVRYISYRLIWMEFVNMFSMYAQSGTHSRFNW